MALPGTAGGAHEESGDAGGADQGAAARRDGGVTPGTALVALRTGLDGVLALPPQAGAETRCTTGALTPPPPEKGPGWAILAGERMVMTEDVGSIFRDGRTLQVSEA